MRYCLVLCTFPNKKIAKKIAKKMVEAKLAACVNIQCKVMSIYEWDYKLVTDKEFLITIKTTSNCLEELKKMISDFHPYEIPEIIVLPIEDGSISYLEWLEKSTKETKCL